MQRGAVFLVEPISRIERQELDFRSFGKVRRFINDEPSGLYASLERHVITVAPKAQPSNLAVACVRSAPAATLRLPELRRVANDLGISSKPFGSGPRGRRFESSRPDQSDRVDEAEFPQGVRPFVFLRDWCNGKGPNRSSRPCRAKNAYCADVRCVIAGAVAGG